MTQEVTDAARPYQWAHASFADGKLMFSDPDEFDRALRDGFFFVDAPARLDFQPGDQFAENFYKDVTSADQAEYAGFRSWTEAQLGAHEGYFCREADQVEQFFLESRLWQSVYPPALVRQAQAMQDLGVAILSAVLERLAIPQSLWDEACGRCLSGKGTYHLTFNHFRPKIRARGLNVHKDSGWVTILRTLEPGLEALIEDEWRAIDPKPGALIVNFGCAIEILTRHTARPVAAVAHRVRSQPERAARDRFSYALFIDSSLDETVSPGLFRYEPEQGLVLQARFSEFLDEILHNTYQEETEGLYDQSKGAR